MPESKRLKNYSFKNTFSVKIYIKKFIKKS